MASAAQNDDAQTTKPFSVLFVCLGNICRSPAAEGVFRHLVKEKGLDSNFFIDLLELSITMRYEFIKIIVIAYDLIVIWGIRVQWDS